MTIFLYALAFSTQREEHNVLFPSQASIIKLDLQLISFCWGILGLQLREEADGPPHPKGKAIGDSFPMD